MSRAYRIRVSETHTRVVHVDDGIELQLELLDVLPRERLSELLRAELLAEGFEEKSDGGSFAKQIEGIDVSVDPDTGTVTIRRSESHEVERTGTAVVLSDQRHAGKERVDASIDAQIEQEKERLQTELTRDLEAQLPKIRQVLDRVSTRVVAAGLKERAAQLGEIEEISEDDAGNLTIRVKV